MEPLKKRVRYSQHCCQNLTYPVYKKHKEQFYDEKNWQWVQRTAEAKTWAIEDPSLDIKDDSIISDALHCAGVFSMFLCTMS